ncbi:hypothetical protein ACYFX5_00220 [Bremerella sp. T1]|uniref:hypothetical protein n=1 Tax=Bremerella sp. TYQ1 TaxID=3119568 RepID=UPI001CCE57A1|nr:hypothetical protein [Bremerella volcania]UBM38965.1 hypothetical protein LA756_02180 [Bremerella volcania]
MLNTSVRLATLFALLSFPVVSFAETLVIDDPLSEGTIGRQYGGKFVDKCYNPGKGENHILYKLPTTIRQGRLTFEIRGMNPDKVNEKEHGFACMYDGHNMAQPIGYSPEFKYNFYRFNMHWRNNRRAIKCVINIATDKKKELAVDDRPMFAADSKMEWRREPTDTGYPFQSDQWYRVHIAWDRIRNKSKPRSKSLMAATEKQSGRSPSRYPTPQSNIASG